MTARKLKKVLTDARKSGIIIKGFKNGVFYTDKNTGYTKMELLLTVYGNDYAPSFLKKD